MHIKSSKRHHRSDFRTFTSVCTSVFLIGCSQGDDTKEIPRETSGNSLGNTAVVADELNIAATDDDWPVYGRTQLESHFSPLTDINTHTIRRLKLAWYVDLPRSSSVSSEPLAVNGVLYTATGLSIVRAHDAETGEELWTYDPKVAEVAGIALRQAWGIRGLASDDGKLFVGTQDGRLIAIDAQTGAPIWLVHTTEKDDGRYITGAPRVFDGKVIIGHGGADYAPVRGYVTAYSAASGEQLWRFYTVPGNPSVDDDATTRLAAETWTGEWWKHGGGGTVWNSITYDPDYNRIYLGTGNGAPWNQKIRSPGGGDNLFLCSIVALDADTGEYVWHYQTVPGETWDMNSAMDIQLADIDVNGAIRKVILHAPKNGFFYVIDREDGKLISAKPFAKVSWATHVDMETGRPVETPDARFPDGDGIIWPGGSAGAHNWQPMSHSKKAGLVYIPTSHMPQYYNFKGIDLENWSHDPDIVLSTGYNPIIDYGGNFPVGASLSSLQAWDPKTQSQKWSVALPGPANGGVLSTAGDLVFQGRSDGVFAAHHAENGDLLWEFNAQNGIVGAPISYAVKGRQMVTVLAGYGGASSSYGVLSEQFRWDYYQQKRRILTFALDGDSMLPETLQKPQFSVVDDPEFIRDADAERLGASIYASQCVHCHGGNAVAGGAAPDLRLSPAILNAKAFEQIVADGVVVSAGMPRFDYFSREELTALRQFVRSRAHETSPSAGAD
jgi:quinohemoprotein ethanol dehydrogenase